MKQLYTGLLALPSVIVATSASAHSDQPNIMSGLLHFLTEPDHLAISGVVAVLVIIGAKRFFSRKA